MKVSSVCNANISSFAFKHLFSWSFLYDKEYPMLVQILIFYDQEYQNIFLETFLLQNSFLFFFFFEKCHFTLTFSFMTTVHFCK